MLKQFLIFMMLIGAGIAYSAKDSYAQGTGTPEQLVHDFYVWYGKSYEAMPLPEMNDEIYKYVSVYTVNRCRIDYLKFCKDSDYFMKGNGIEAEDFVNMIIGKAVPVGDGVMVVPVTLTARGLERLPHFIVFVRKEEGKWRVIKVENWR